eukprot:TRINITY_DN5655_c0_g1_i2.p1 TRINITY_DN5655_c0_g1~~TRINITY_DN5655_c0_g1_i2.p1  ORF type:complete len:337 (-),score=86.26 TRINITY_DN5655_c0_g1_i2:99-1109(-)
MFELERLLSSITVEQTLKAHTLQYLRDFDTVVAALKAFASAKVQSLPVLDDAKAILGIIDYMDIVLWLTERNPDLLRPIGLATDSETYWHTFEQTHHLAKVTVSDVMGFSATNTIVTCSLTYKKAPTLYNLALTFAANPDLRRVVVQNNKSEVVGLISLANIVEVIARDISVLGDKAGQTIASLGLLKRPASTVADSVDTLHAFHKLHEAGSYAAVLVNSAGEATGFISASDVRHVSPTDVWSQLNDNVTAFLAAARRVPGASAQRLVSATPQSTLADMFKIAVAERVHRIVVLEGKKPVGMVRLSDLLHVALAEVLKGLTGDAGQAGRAVHFWRY